MKSDAAEARKIATPRISVAAQLSPVLGRMISSAAAFGEPLGYRPHVVRQHRAAHHNCPAAFAGPARKRKASSEIRPKHRSGPVTP
jgi:hypothetical protein